MFTNTLLYLSAVSVALAQKCPLQFDGRTTADSTPASFDLSTSLFDTDSVFGKNLTWSKIIKLPETQPSLFDAKSNTKATEVTICDLSIFAPSETNVQTGFRRAELVPSSNNGSDPSTTGIRTLHFSLRKDVSRPLNISHEYQLVFLESADFSTNQFVLKTGTILGSPKDQDPNLLVLQSNVKDAKNLFTVSFEEDNWQNFGVVLDFTKNTTQVFYSTGSEPLQQATTPLPNDISGQGQFHFGMLKKPTGEGLTDITKQGFQEAGIDEGVIYGGIFEEKSESGCISLSA